MNFITIYANIITFTTNRFASTSIISKAIFSVWPEAQVDPGIHPVNFRL